MVTLTIKNLPDSLYEQLKLTAAKHRRSINSEVIVQLENALPPPIPKAQEMLKEIREFRKKMPKVDLTDEFWSMRKMRAGHDCGRYQCHRVFRTSK
jgi:plasmid stability protein